MTDKQWDDELENADISGLSAQELEALIHELTARRLVEALRSEDLGHRYGTIANARGFLKDNEVTGLDVPGSAQAELKKRLAEQAPFKMTGTD
jgi:hypothetical protein